MLSWQFATIQHQMMLSRNMTFVQKVIKQFFIQGKGCRFNEYDFFYPPFFNLKLIKINDIQHTAYSIQHTAFSIQHTAYSIEHTAYSIEHTAYSIQHRAYSIQHTAYSIQHTAYSIQQTAYRIGNVDNKSMRLQIQAKVELGMDT